MDIGVHMTGYLAKGAAEVYGPHRMLLVHKAKDGRRTLYLGVPLHQETGAPIYGQARWFDKDGEEVSSSQDPERMTLTGHWTQP